MKKSFITALLFACLLIAPSGAWAAGTCTETPLKILSANVYQVTWTCTADSGDNSFPATDSKQAINGYVFYVKTIPSGATAPTDQYDIVLNDSDGIDIMGGELANRSDTAGEEAVPKIDAVYGSRWVDGILEIAITGNSVASAITVVRVRFYR